LVLIRILAHNVFNSSQVEPYTGRLEIKDYLTDLQLPQMVDLVEKYNAEIMVCCRHHIRL
jgi:alpha-L-fucosidase